MSSQGYSAHPSTQGLGPIGEGKGKGFLLHSPIGAPPDEGRVLGLGHAQALLRTAKKKPQNSAYRSEEARVWESSASHIGRSPAGKQWVHVSDSGSDMFEDMLACWELDKHVLLRVWSNRLLYMAKFGFVYLAMWLQPRERWQANHPGGHRFHGLKNF